MNARHENVLTISEVTSNIVNFSLAILIYLIFLANFNGCEYGFSTMWI